MILSSSPALEWVPLSAIIGGDAAGLERWLGGQTRHTARLAISGARAAHLSIDRSVNTGTGCYENGYVIAFGRELF